MEEGRLLAPSVPLLSNNQLLITRQGHRARSPFYNTNFHIYQYIQHFSFFGQKATGLNVLCKFLFNCYISHGQQLLPPQQACFIKVYHKCTLSHWGDESFFLSQSLPGDDVRRRGQLARRVKQNVGGVRAHARLGHFRHVRVVKLVPPVRISTHIFSSIFYSITFKIAEEILNIKY